jgi:hypothetical protein
MSLLREIPNTRVFIVENTNYTFKTSTAPIPRVEQFIGVADVQLIYSDRSPGLNLGNVTYVENPNVPPVPYGINRTEYEILGVPTNSLNQGFNFYRSRVNVKIPGIPNQYGFFDTLAQRFSGFARYPTWAPEYWKSPHFPVNTWFWWCVVSNPPMVIPNQIFTVFRGFPFEAVVNLESPTLRIPEKVTATNLPFGARIDFDERPTATLAQTGFHTPEKTSPVLAGIISQNGNYPVQVSATNPLGTSTATVIIQVVNPPPGFLAVGGAGASALYTGNTPVDALYLGASKVYP